MKIKTIIFSDKKNPSFSRIESIISDAFTSITGTSSEEASSSYNTVQSGLPEIAGALRTNNIIALFADEKLYHEAKRCICKAFKFEMIHSDEILENQKSMENSERYMIHALVPENATAFPLEDGLFPGFAVRSKKQCIFFLPFSEDRTFITMKKYVFPYISRVYGAYLPSFNEYETAYAASVLENALLETGVQIAVSNTPLSKYIAHAGKKIECFNDFISYAPYDTKYSSTDASCLAATKAAEYYECQFGASIIEEENDANGNFSATITISNRKTAKIRTLSSVKDESYDDFMTTVTTEFFLMLAQEISQTPIMTEKEIKHISPTSVISGAQIALYIILFAAAFFLTYVATSFSDLSIFS